MTKLMLSVIIPAHNASRTIARCLHSVLELKTWDNEVIVVDDGSTDDTLQIVREFSMNDDRVRVASQAQAGPSAARNAGIDLAYGQYILFLDADDWLDAEVLDRCLGMAVETDADAVRAHFRYRYPGGQPRTPPLRFEPGEYRGHAKVQRIRVGILTGMEQGFSSLWLIKRNMLDVRFPDGIDFMEDVVFLDDLLQRLEFVLIVPDILLNYEQSAQSLVRSPDRVIRNILGSIRVLERIVDGAGGSLTDHELSTIGKGRIEQMGRMIVLAAAEKQITVSDMILLAVEFKSNQSFTALNQKFNSYPRSFPASAIINDLKKNRARLAWVRTLVLASGWHTYRLLRSYSKARPKKLKSRERS